MHQGLAMPLDERQARHKSLLGRIRASSARQYCVTFLAALRAAGAEAPMPRVATGAARVTRASAAKLPRRGNHVVSRGRAVALVNGGLPLN